jgi:hypothetical protein
VAVVFAVIGAANADPWPFVLGFIGFGAAVDIWFARAGMAARPGEGQSVDQPRRRGRATSLLIGYLAALGALYIIVTILAINHPTTLAAVGPIAYSIASPFVALLRNHYQDLVEHGLTDRANAIAVNYAGQFLMFYSVLGLLLGKVGHTKASRTARAAVKPGAPNSSLSWGQSLLLVFVLVALFHFMTWADIDYHDHYYRRRHINMNLAESDSFILYLAFSQVTFLVLLPLLLAVARLLPRAALPPPD